MTIFEQAQLKRALNWYTALNGATDFSGAKNQSMNKSINLIKYITNKENCFLVKVNTMFNTLVENINEELSPHQKAKQLQTNRILNNQ